MLWYKSWLDTRWQFLIGLTLVMLSACGTVLAYPRVEQLIPALKPIDTAGEIGRRISEAAELARTYRGYVFSQSFRQNLLQMATLLAALLGSGSPLTRGSRGAALFTLSLPVTRERLLTVRAAAGLLELFAISLAPALVVTVLSPGIGERYSVVDALVHAVCMFAAATVFFSLSFVLSTVFSDMWRPFLLACGAAVVLAVAGLAVPGLSSYSLFNVMSGERYFWRGQLPWLGLFASVALSAALLFGAMRNVAWQDF